MCKDSFSDKMPCEKLAISLRSMKHDDDDQKKLLRPIFSHASESLH